MIDVEDALRAELNRLVTVDERRDWDEIVARAGLRRDRRRQRLTMCAVAVGVAALLGVATPLGSALAQGLDDFSAWLTGQPGSPVSDQEQHEFDAANARSWAGFPEGTQLRRLITKKAGDARIDLLGFRSGSSTLCLRLTVTGTSRTSTLRCTPLADLRSEGGPARVVLADQPVGKGTKVAWYGIDRIHSAHLQITAGIASDEVTSIVLEDDAGRHVVPVSSNAFLYVAKEPEVAQRVERVWAQTPSGLVSVPFVPTPFGLMGAGPQPPAPTGPPIERALHGGRVGWLENHEPRGESLDVLPARALGPVSGRGRSFAAPTKVLFGRVLTPDPDRPLRIALTLNAHQPGGPPAGLCTWLVLGNGAAGGCAPYPAVFERSLMPSSLTGGGSGATVTVSGVTSDDVARLEVLLANGDTTPVPFVDNAFIVDIPRSSLPARLIAYDAANHVIAVGDPWYDMAGGGASPARGRAKSLLRVTGPGRTRAELLVGPSTDGGQCVYVKHFFDPRHAGASIGCTGKAWTGPALQLSSQSQPVRLISGRVRADVTTVRIHFADGTSTTLEPTQGYVLWAAPAEHLKAQTGAISAAGLNRAGKVVGRISFKPRKS